MLPGSLVVGTNLGIGEADPVLPIFAWTALDHGGDHFHDRQDFPLGRVRLGSAFDLSNPLIKGTRP
jgi:hypothetical protein